MVFWKEKEKKLMLVLYQTVTNCKGKGFIAFGQRYVLTIGISLVKTIRWIKRFPGFVIVELLFKHY